jgi:hypothetical protein
MSSPKKVIHKTIKKALGYPEDIDDKEFLKDWKHRTSQVCKPCWELKYCPYGPFVEQSPLLPSTRADAIAHHGHIKNILETGLVGSADLLDDEERKEVEELVAVAKVDPSVLARRVASALLMDRITRLAEKEGKNLLEYMRAPMSDFEKLRVRYPLDGNDEDAPVIEGELKDGIEAEIKRLEEVVRTGIDDQRQPLDAARKRLFETEVSSFDSSEFPDELPEIILDSKCKNFGHICPVVFVGESITETAEKRRRGRYIPFKIKIRVVRRDNYTCQECGVHLKDDEVEFDHIIPHAKGGSAEEHNIRLTCFDCNRDKSDHVDM